MTTKTPSGLAAGGAASDDETIDDSLDEILLRANDKPVAVEGSVRSQLPKLQLPRPTNTATLLGLPVPSLPLPGTTPVAPSPEITPAVMPRSDEVTQIARSSLLDEPIEEETKVEPVETARRAAASKVEEEVEVALTEQASAEREKALRKSFPPPPSMSDEVDTGAEFEDPQDRQDSEYQRDADASDTPASIAVGEDDDESTANGRGPLSGSGGGGLAAPVSLSNSRLPLPTSTILGRSEPFAARLPTPGAGFGVPAPSPAFGVPSSSPPLGVSAYASPAPATGYGPPPGSSAYGGTRASSPAVPIPAPLGAPASVRRSPLFNKVQLPVGGLVAFLIAAFSLGLVVGALRWRGEESEIPVVVAPPAAASVVIQPTAPPPVAAPVVQPVAPAQPPAAAAEAEPAPVPAAPAQAAVAVEPAPIPAAATPPKPPRPARRAATVPTDPTQAAGSTASSLSPTASTTTKPKASKKPASGAKGQVDSRGVAKGWVDPFAQ